MVLRHEVFAGEERLAVENADPPVERRRQEFLRDDEVGVLEEDLELFVELASAEPTLTTPRENELSGRLSTQGKPSSARDVDRVVAMETTVLGMGMSCRLSSSAR